MNYCKQVTFIIYRGVQPSPSSSFRTTLSSLRGTLYPFTITPPPTPPCPWQPRNCLLSLWLCLLCTFPFSGVLDYVILGVLASFMQRHVSEVHPCCGPAVPPSSSGTNGVLRRQRPHLVHAFVTGRLLRLCPLCGSRACRSHGCLRSGSGADVFSFLPGT